MNHLNKITLGAVLLTLLTSLIPSSLRADSKDSPPEVSSAQETIEQLRQQLVELDQKVKILERKDELAEEEAAKKKKESPTFRAGDKGFQFTSADKRFNLRIGGLLQSDARFFVDDRNGTATDTFLVRRVRPYVSGKVFEHFEFRITPEFAGANLSLLDAWINFKPTDEIQLQFGKFKGPVGLERLQSGANIEFVERGLPTGLVPNRDIGVQLHGQVYDEVFNYQVGVFNGTTDGGSSVTDTSDAKEVAGRIFVHPFKKTNWTYVEGFGVGVAGTYGDRDGAPSGYLTPGQRTWFSYNANVTGDGEASRLVPQGYWYYGPFGFLGEWAISRQRLTTTSGAPIRDNIQTEAWQFAAYYVIFGGDASYKGVKPKKEFDLSGENWGALELVGRYGEQWIDDSVFIARGGQSLASTTANARSIDTWGVGLNWYLNTNVRLVLDYNHSNFSSRGLANTAVPRDDEQAVFSRLQLSF